MDMLVLWSRIALDQLSGLCGIWWFSILLKLPFFLQYCLMMIFIFLLTNCHFFLPECGEMVWLFAL